MKFWVSEPTSRLDSANVRRMAKRFRRRYMRRHDTVERSDALTEARIMRSLIAEVMMVPHHIGFYTMKGTFHAKGGR